MSMDEIYCAKCNSQTDETLLLSCEHNLCIPCAADKLSHSNVECANMSNAKMHIITCDFCRSQTELDPMTVKEILSVNANPPQTNGSGIQNYSQSNIYPNISDSFNNYTHHLHQSNSNLFVPIQSEVCVEHGEPITYLCFDCLSKCICAECVVHGVHKNHEVINVKKAYPLIYEKTEDLLSSVENKIKDLTNMNINIDNRKTELTNHNEKCKRDISVAFEEIRMKLNKKEKDILDKADSILKDNINELNTYSRLLQSKIISLNKTIESIQAHLMRKNELTLINFYCENNNKINNNIMLHDLKCLPDLSNVSHMKINMNKQSFDVLLNALSTLSYEVGSLKGIDVNSGVNVQRYTMQRNLYGSVLNVNNSGNNNNDSNINVIQGSGVRNRTGGSFMRRKNCGE